VESLRSVLGAGLLQRIEKELGPESTLRLLWPHLVGAQLAAHTKLKAIRGGALIVAVPDRGWRRSLGALDRMILDAVNRWSGEHAYGAVEFVEDPQMPRPAKIARTARRRPLPELDFDTAMISDPELRAAFENSARKYLARPVPGATANEMKGENAAAKKASSH